MDVRDLDRLISKTELTPTSKMMLKAVRKSVMRGRVAGPFMSDYKWSIISQDFGQGAKITFSLKREQHGDDQN